MHAKSLQSCPTLWDPVNSNPPGSSVRGIFQARVLEWVAIAFSPSHLKPSQNLAWDSNPHDWNLNQPNPAWESQPRGFKSQTGF